MQFESGELLVFFNPLRDLWESQSNAWFVGISTNPVRFIDFVSLLSFQLIKSLYQSNGMPYMIEWKEKYGWMIRELQG